MQFQVKGRVVSSSGRRAGWITLAVSLALWLPSLYAMSSAQPIVIDPELDIAHLFTASGTVDSGASEPGVDAIEVFVREVDPASAVAESVVADVGGIVRDQAGDFDGFVATIPANQLTKLITSDSIVRVSVNPNTP